MTGSDLRFEDVRVRYRRGATVVDGVSLTVPDGTVLGLVGESGSGKSSLARAAVGLAPIVSGRVLVGGQDASRPPRGSRGIQMVFQDPYAALDPRMTVGDAVAEGMRERGRADRRAAVRRLLELVHLDGDLVTRLPADLSGGQRQRVSLARALAARPRVLIADEITSALDVSVQGAVLNVLREVQRQLGLTLLFISHNLAVVRYVSDAVAVMAGGRVVESGPTADVIAAPRDAYTRELLAAVPVLGERFGDTGGTR